MNAKNFKEFTPKFKSQDLWQLNEIKKDLLRVCEIRTTTASSSMAEAFIGAGNRDQKLA